MSNDSNQHIDAGSWKRRDIVKAAGAAGAAGLAGCLGGDNGADGPRPIEVEEWPPEEYENDLMVWNWYVDWRDYILEDFQAEHDIDNVSTDAYSDPSQWYSRLQAGNDDIDSIGSTGEWTARAMENDLIEPLPVDIMPSWEEHVPEEFKADIEEHFSQDGEIYGLPQAILVSPTLTYNEDYFDEPPTSWDVLWDEEYADQMFMWDRPRHACQIGAFYTGQGTNPDDWDYEEIREVLIQQKDLNVTYWEEYSSAMQMFVNEEVVVGPFTDGRSHMARFQEDAPISFAVPEEGTTYAMDHYVIPQGTPNPRAALLFTNYAASPESARQMFLQMGYRPPLTDEGFQEAVGDEASDEEIEYLLWEDDWDLDLIRPIDDEHHDRMDEVWTEVKAA